ncbi:hypothetical protein R4Z09_15480 [Niallia oryzisoli]|uniref:Uncharacterized protein n=1 Tax=Niallia oryzisoli TaxID=1737571 RepID=A0ABZ2CKD2_9BACI
MEMNKVLTDLHKKRFEWAFQAKKEFLDQFVRLDVEKIDRLHRQQEDSFCTDVKLLPFQSLTNCFKVAEGDRKQEHVESEKELKMLEHFISEKKAQMEQKLNFFHMKNREFSSKIKNYTDFLHDIESIIQEMEHTDKESIVKNYVKYDVKQKKASILNGHAEQLQISIKNKIENQLTEIRERADRLDLLQDSLLRLPKQDPIPKIQQKIDSYWFTSRYDKSFNQLLLNGTKWVEQIYQSFKVILMPLINEALMLRNQLLYEVESLNRMKEENIAKLQMDLTKIEIERDYLRKEQVKMNEMWEKDLQHANQLQGYFMKHWLLYKEELQRQFLSENPEERWAAFQYLKLLQQDGENIIESMNI